MHLSGLYSCACIYYYSRKDKKKDLSLIFVFPSVPCIMPLTWLEYTINVHETTIFLYVNKVIHLKHQ